MSAAAPAPLLAAVLVDELVRSGVREAVLAPGMRSAPLALALHAADEAGRLRLHVRIDERSAAFLALGLAKASGRCVPVACTSGTAAANLHPAVLEADQAGVALLVVTADRPPELRGAGANQTVDQVKLYGSAVRWFAEVGVPEGRGPGEAAYWRTVADRAVAAAAGTLSADPGPVHLNLPFREPLVPDGVVEVPPGRAGEEPWTSITVVERTSPPVSGSPGRTLVVAGDAPAWLGSRARVLASAAGWPLLAEPSSGARGATALSTYPLLLDVPGLVDALRPERVLVVGRPTLSRPVAALLRDPAVRVEVRTAGPRWPDPGRQAAAVAFGLPAEPVAADADPEWLGRWQALDAAARAAVDEVLDAQPRLVGTSVARDVARAVPAGGLLVVGSSLPVRDLDLAPGLDGVRVLANRGAAGIDGTVSTGVGAALSHGGPAWALLGDLTFLHDTNGLVLGPDEPRPDLCVVVVDNGGGGLFARLETGAPALAGAFSRTFGTPHGVDLAALCAASGTGHACARSADDLASLLGAEPGLRVVHVPTDPKDEAAVDDAIRAAVRERVSRAL